MSRPTSAARLTAVCLAVGFATLVDQSVLTVAVPSLRSSLGAGTAEVQWLVAAYSLGFALALVPAGRLGDVHGRRGLLVGGVAAFSLLSLVAATARSADVVIACRFLQGIGAGTANPQVIGLFQDHFTGWRRTRALGAYATVGAFAGVLAPALGGAVIAAASGPGAWRWVVLLNAPFGLGAAVLGLRWLPRGPGRSRRRADLDLVGVLLLVGATVAVLVPAVAVTGGAPAPLWAWGVAVALVAVLVRWERAYGRRGGRPILLPALFASRRFVLGTLAATCAFGSSLGASLVLVLFLQEGLGLSAWQAGLVGVPGAVVGAVVSSVAWRVATRYGRPAVTVALTVVAASSLLSVLVVLTAAPGAAVAGLVAAQVLGGIGGGLVHAPNQSLTLEDVPAGAAGLAAGVLQVTQRISAVLALAVLGGVVLSTAVAGDLASYRHAAALGFGTTAALTGVAAAFSAADAWGRRRAPVPAPDVTPRAAPVDAPALVT